VTALENSESAPFAPLIGQKAQGCWLGYGTALFLEFGEPQSPNDLRNHRSGEWSLWCDQILWRIEHEDRVLGGCEDDEPTMDRAIEQLNGHILSSWADIAPNGRLAAGVYRSPGAQNLRPDNGGRRALAIQTLG
jgi:hypothetical protein